MSVTIQFFVAGTPVQGGSKTAFCPINKKTGQPFRRPGGSIIINVVDDAGKRNKEWKKLVGWKAKEAMAGEAPWTGPTKAHFIFHMPRPKYHFRTNGQLTPKAPLHCLTKPDALKLARSTEDAMTGIVYQDDAQVVSGTQEKIYAQDKPGAMITITFLDDEPTPEML